MAEKTQILITVSGGVAYLETELPKNIMLVIRDYDVTEESDVTKVDVNGDLYIESIYNGD